jgi:hypothetical protein
MKAWQIAFFILCLNLSVAAINSIDLFTATFPYRYNFITGENYTITNSSYVINVTGSTNISEAMEDFENSKKGLTQEGVTSGLIPAADAFVNGILTGVSGLTLLFQLFIACFLGVYGYLVTFWIPADIALAIQGALDCIMIYGGIQFIMGRSGKTVE